METVYDHGHLALIYERMAESSGNEDERKCPHLSSREQWQLAFDMDVEGSWSAYKNKFFEESPRKRLTVALSFG